MKYFFRIPVGRFIKAFLRLFYQPLLFLGIAAVVFAFFLAVVFKTSWGQSFLLDQWRQAPPALQESLVEVVLNAPSARRILEERDQNLQDGLNATRQTLEDLAQKVLLLEKRDPSLKSLDDLKQSVLFLERIVVQSLQKEVRLGLPFRESLQLALSLANTREALELSKLLPLAESGVPSYGVLKNMLGTIDQDLLSPAARYEGAGLWHALMRKILAPIRLERVLTDTPFTQAVKDVQETWDEKGLGAALQRAQTYQEAFPAFRIWISRAGETVAVEKILLAVLERNNA